MRRLVLTLVLLAGFATPALAQERVVVFLHGFNSSAASWVNTATRLQARLDIVAHVPELPWHLPYDTQANQLNAAANAIGAPADMVAVGHSNGGLVARALSTKRPLGGIVTLGSPHRGALLAGRLDSVTSFYLQTGNKLGLLLWMLGASGPTNQFTGIWFSPGMAYVRAAVAGLGLVLQQALIAVQVEIAPILSAPVLADMRPGSATLNALNSGGNLARESAAVPKRAGMVFIARDWGLAAPFVAGKPEWQHQAAQRLHEAVVVLSAIYQYFSYPNFAPWDPVAATIRLQAAEVIGDVNQFSPIWCWATADDPSCSVSTDGVVPTASQYFPGDARNFGYYGPAHIQEKDQSAEQLEGVLVQHIGLHYRGATGGNPGGGTPSSTLSAGERLYADQRVVSPNGAYMLLYQNDGNLVFYGPSGPLWASDTIGQPPGFATMQGDGNLVVYRADGVPIWATDTSGMPGAELRVQDDGYLVLYDAGNTPMWWVPTP
jgi:pimeloyl-ACP methyl ester carboxylesterase